MPDVDDLARLWRAWDDAGRTSGLEPLRWADVEAFGRIAGLDAQEQITIRRMSEAYLDGLALRNPLSIMPIESQS